MTTGDRRQENVWKTVAWQIEKQSLPAWWPLASIGRRIYEYSIKHTLDPLEDCVDYVQAYTASRICEKSMWGNLDSHLTSGVKLLDQLHDRWLPFDLPY